MGTTFVTLSRVDSGNDPGFWMRDNVLELWLRLLSLHLPEPQDDGKFHATIEIRNRWLLASRGYFIGCVPHCMEDACATQEGSVVVRMAIDSLMGKLNQSKIPLDPDTLNLLCFEGVFTGSIDRNTLVEVGYAFLDLIDGKITSSARATDIMPGSKPYKRA